MLSKNLSSEINTQIKLELYSAYLYLSMAAYFEAEKPFRFCQLDEKTGR